MWKIFLVYFVIFSISILSLSAQKSVDVDGRLQPLLTDFFAKCDAYGIPYNDKLFKLKKIDIVDTLPLSENGSVLGKVERNIDGEIESIIINWVVLLDEEILKVVAFHEFAHHFLEYKHTCQDCNEIMAVQNKSYFAVARDWDNQVEHLFTTSPAYLETIKSSTIVSIDYIN
ncbi:hypothetical protein H0I23_15490 [Cellulophaga sp. HaHaR_3_176]|uniref:hypothetical protein n=1 Tax=Cellulophaga sp. HaHaR_3_176 TaxID=1942464 RepID=UPI001C1FD12F|nr:hypothetical protein [Cellulophaga sp. HaHaR_3_176]QWX83835.1 hypothetical protein H0I23_15490 [Cellulophaga sp. HaHaR_3_176]